MVNENYNKQEYDHPFLISWFNMIPAEEWFEMAKVSAENKWFTGNQRQFLFDMGKKAGRGTNLSLKQLSTAKRLYDEYENFTEEKVIPKPKQREKVNANHSHLTVRMAWHDNKWNGRVCNDPESNEYCVGDHSLLSRRLRQRRNLEIEKEAKGEPIDSQKINGYLPPCFWSINAFSPEEYKISHDNPAQPSWQKIDEPLPPYSVFSWPFRLSFTRTKEESDRDGKYPGNLESRIKRFKNKLKENESIVFYYTNYDNPISGEEQKYLVVGCALLKESGDLNWFDVSEEELNKIRSYHPNRNFPYINWSIRISTHYPANSVLLPYHEYLEDAVKSNSYEALNEIKVTVTEPELQQCFKYVAMDIDHDQAIYLLTKIKKSLYKIQTHGKIPNYDVEGNLENIESLLEHAWKKRGHLPGFNELVTLALDREENEIVHLHSVIPELFKKYGKQYVDKLKEILDDPSLLDGDLIRAEDEIEEIKENLEAKDLSINDFLRLSMLNLKRGQYKRIWKEQISDNDITINEIANNLYLLYEEYDVENYDALDDLNTGEQIDGPIELFKIDIALYPDSRYLKKLRDLQSYKVSDKRRVRALILAHLKGLDNWGHCFDDQRGIMEALEEYPLFYKSEYILPKGLFSDMDNELEGHLSSKINIQKHNSRLLFYLRDIWRAEEYIKEIIEDLIKRNEIPEPQTFNIDDYLTSSVDKLSDEIGDYFNKEEFVRERKILFSNIFRKSFFIINGGPGTGKSYELLKIINYFKEKNEDYILLAPTGKAVLRLSSDRDIPGIKAQTIDKFIYDWEENEKRTRREIENVIVDEMSMVDILKLDKIFRAIDFNSKRFKRLIFVGDPHQLPPIGFGKPFVDIIDYLNRDEEKRNNHMVTLRVNCRQKLDQTILDFARVFSGEIKNYEEILHRVLKGGPISNGLYVDYWYGRDELRKKITERFETVFKEYPDADLGVRLDRLFGLTEQGTLDGENFRESLYVDNYQILTPYRTTFYGSIGLNNYIQNEFRSHQDYSHNDNIALKRGDKVIQVENLYKYDEKLRRRELILSNGSIGLYYGKDNKDFLFPEIDMPLKSGEFQDEHLELGYAITVHKAQGSSFEHVFLVIPERMTLLSRELIYTALTRSRAGISIFVHKQDDYEKIENTIYHKIKNVTHVGLRRTTLMGQPIWEYNLSPDKGIIVKSRVEYIIYKKLQEYKERRLNFEFQYEQELPLEKRHFNIHPDFTITLQNGKTIYWEHLGLLTDYNYAKDWDKRRRIYEEKGLMDNLVTTDELTGIRDENVSLVIEDILDDKIANNATDGYSLHHYKL